MGIIGCSDPKTDTAWIPPSPSNVIDGVKYVSGNWKPHLAAGDKGLSWGNHRAVVHVENPTANSIRVEIPWRRLDADPEEKAIVIEDSTSGEPIPNALARDVTAESGRVPVARPGSASGCEIKPSGRAAGPFGPVVLLLGLTLLIRRRRA